MTSRDDDAVMFPSPRVSVDLGLDRPSSLSKENHPRRFLSIPSPGTHNSDILVYGGNKGVIRTLQELREIPRCWDEDEDIRALAISKDATRIAVGLDSGSTLFITYKKDDDLLSKEHAFVKASSPLPPAVTGPTFAAPVRDLQYHPQRSDWCAVATEEGFCCLHISDASTITKHLEQEATQAHDGGGVRALCFSPRGDFLASLGMDGRLCLWRTPMNHEKDPQWKLLHRDATRCVTKRDTGEILGADAWDRSCRPLFLSEEVLVLPGETYLQFRRIIPTPKEKDAFVVKEQMTETLGHVESLVTFVAVYGDATNGRMKYFIATGRDKRLTLWSLRIPPLSVANSKGDHPPMDIQMIRSIAEMPSAPTDLLWHKEESSALYVACADGSMTKLPGDTIDETIQKSNKSMASSVQEIASPKKKQKSHSTIPDAAKMIDSDDDVFQSDDDDGKGANKSSNIFIDDEAEGSDDDDPELSPSVKDTPRPRYPEDDDDDHLSTGGVEDYRTTTALYPVASTRHAMQPPFAPSSSPLDLTRRFLCWNHVGSVTLRHMEGGGEGRNIVDIHFTDSGVRRPISFTDTLGFILGSVGEDGGVFATDCVEDEEDDEDDDLLGDVAVLSEKTRQAVKKSRRKQRDPNQAPSGSTIYFHRFETFASLRDKDWYLTLPNGERVLGCATGTGWVAAMTSRRFLRLFSSGGNQGQILWLDGPPITMVGRDRFLAVFFHQGEPHRDGTQNIGYQLIDAMSNRVLKTGFACCISAGATLTWAGFSSEGSLIVMDSEGMVSMLVLSVDAVAVDPTTSTEWVWIPVLDTLGLRKASDDSYWPVTVYEGKLICVPLKGKVKYPDATRRPVTATLSFKLPVARSTLASINTFEELSIRAEIALSQKKVIQEIAENGEDENFQREYHALSAQVDKVTLKMFAAVVEAGKLERALDLVERLHLEKSFEIAMTIADNHRKLVDLIEDVKERRFSSMMDYTADDESPIDLAPRTSFSRPKISPDNSSLLKRSLQDAETRHVRPKQSFT